VVIASTICTRFLGESAAIYCNKISFGIDQTTTGFARMLGTYGMDLLYPQVVHDAVRKAAGTCGGITQRDLAEI
jgi:hypothetical protein